MINFKYSIPLAFIREDAIKEKKKNFKIFGDAINEGITRNKYKYTKEELELAAKSLVGKPILKDHKEEVDAIVGKVVGARFEGNAVKFDGMIMDERIQEMVEDGRIQNVSIGAKVNDLVKEGDGESEIMNVKGIEFLELSLVAVPGDPNATINHALAESYTKIQRERGERKMKKVKEQEEEQEEPTPVEPNPSLEEVKALLQQALALLKELGGEEEKEVPPEEAPPEEAPPEEAPAERMRRRIAKPKGLVVPGASQKGQTITEGNKEILLLESGKRFVTERTKTGVSFWMEDE